MFKCNECGWASSHSDRCLNCGNTKNEESVTLFSFEKLFLEKLKDLCQSYDYRYGSYPESYYEGKAIYEFCLESQNEQNNQKNKSSVNFDEPYDVFVENWEKS